MSDIAMCAAADASGLAALKTQKGSVATSEGIDSGTLGKVWWLERKLWPICCLHKKMQRTVTLVV